MKSKCHKASGDDLRCHRIDGKRNKMMINNKKGEVIASIHFHIP